MTERRKEYRRETDQMVSLIHTLRDTSLRTARKSFWNGLTIGIAGMVLAGLLMIALLFENREIAQWLP